MCGRDRKSENTLVLVSSMTINCCLYDVFCFFVFFLNNYLRYYGLALNDILADEEV